MSNTRRVRRKAERFLVARVTKEIKKDIEGGESEEMVLLKFYQQAVNQLKTTIKEEINGQDSRTVDSNQNGFGVL